MLRTERQQVIYELTTEEAQEAIFDFVRDHKPKNHAYTGAVDVDAVVEFAINAETLNVTGVRVVNTYDVAPKAKQEAGPQAEATEGR